MALKQISAIIRPELLETVERHLKQMDVAGITVTRAKGVGENADILVTSDGMFSSVRIDIFLNETQVQKVVDAIMEAAGTGRPGDGIIAVLPADSLYRIRDKQELT
jgi:nitrogen regulatory protein P-II 1